MCGEEERMKTASKILLLLLISVLVVSTLTTNNNNTGFITSSFDWSDIKVVEVMLDQPRDFVVKEGGDLIIVNNGKDNLLYFNNSVNGSVVQTAIQNQFGTAFTAVTLINSANSVLLAGTAANGTSYLYTGDPNDLSQSLNQISPSFNSNNNLTGWPKTYGLAFSPVTNLVYVSDLDHQVVLAYQIEEDLDAHPYKIFPPNVLTKPAKIIADCKGGFWVADQTRVVYYAQNDTNFSKFLGQNPSILNSSATIFTHPTGLAFNFDCSVLFVGDQNRVLRFRTPFSTGQAAEAILGGYNSGGSSHANTTEFQNVDTIHFVDFMNGTGRLYVCDTGASRIISGITTTGDLRTKTLMNQTQYLTLNCSQIDLVRAKSCVVQGGLQVGPQQTLVFNYTQLQVTGDIVLSNGSFVVLNIGQNITATGTIQFSGTLIINNNNNNYNSSSGGESSTVNITLFSFNSSMGEFGNIQVVGDNGTEGVAAAACRRTSTPVYGQFSLILMLTQKCSPGTTSSNSGTGGDGDEDGNKSVDNRIIIGVIVGVGGFVLIVGLVLFIISIVVLILIAHSNRLQTSIFANINDM